VKHTYKSELLRELGARGFIHQISDGEALDRLASSGPVTAYIGFDLTATSLHVGSLVQIMMLRWLQKCGHRPIVLMGAGTTRIGDPSGKDEARKLLAPAQIDANKAGIAAVFDRFLDFGAGGAIVADNSDWLLGLSYVDFLRDIGRHFSVNRMLTFEAVKLRLEREQPLSFLEFNYMVLQAYDFVELYRRHGCRLQMGGSDQWGNIVSGIDLGRRVEAVELYALTSPLIATASGAKMGKTAEGAVWLDADLVSPYEYWQFWRNAHDRDVGRFLRLFTEIGVDEIARLERLDGQELNEAKKILATEATALAHGRTAARDAAETAVQTFELGAIGGALPTIEVARDTLAAGLGILAANVAAGLVSSNSEARREIRGRALRVNDVVVTDEQAVLTEADLTEAGVIKLSRGRKRHALIRPA